MALKHKIIVAITGASGSIYGYQLITSLKKYDGIIEDCAIVFSENGKKVWQFELETKPELLETGNFRLVDNSDIFDKISSGSTAYQTMIIIPCSMGTLGRIASGIANDVISRAADVILKEKRQLIIVPREAPLNKIHLRNMTILADAGATIIPASPFFYHKPKTIEELTKPFIERVLSIASLPSEITEWKG